MKKLATFVFALLLGASLSFAQAGTGGSTGTDKSTGGQTKTTTTETKKKGGKKKGGKKTKKAPTGSSSPAPK